MATDVLGSVKRLVHDTATALIDNQIPQKMSELAASAVKSGFDIVGDVLAIVRDLTKEQAGEQPQP